MRRQKIRTPSVRPRLVFYTFAPALVLRQFPGMQQAGVARDYHVGEMFDRRIPLMSVFPRITERPYVLFGHSLGARVAFEVTRLCQLNGMPLPARLIASASRAPHLPKREAPIHDLPCNRHDTLLLIDVTFPPAAAR
jgi:surfactin synthase thioesterase subunit